MKVQMSLSEELVKRLDSYAKSNYLTRSATVTIAVNQFLANNEAQGLLRDMSMAMKKIAETGVLDDNAKAQFQKFESAFEIMGL